MENLNNDKYINILLTNDLNKLFNELDDFLGRNGAFITKDDTEEMSELIKIFLINFFTKDDIDYLKKGMYKNERLGDSDCDKVWVEMLQYKLNMIKKAQGERFE